MIFEFGNIAISIPYALILVSTILLAFGMTYMVIPSIVTVSKEKHLFDRPNSRKSHHADIPNLGGAAVYIGMLIPLVLFGDLGFEHELKYILISLTILFFIGIKDDILIISPKKKLIAELFAICIIVVLGDIRVTNFHGFLGVDALPYFISILFTVFLFIVIINGFNLIDGIDGLAAGVGILTMTSLGLWFVFTGDYPYGFLSFSAAGSLLAFFWFNVFGKSNKIFLGDTGSLIVGMTATILTVKYLESSLTDTFGSIYKSAPALAIGLLIVPLIDTLRVFTIRIIAGKSPFKADRSHIHHRLLALQLTHKQATTIILGFNILIVFLSFQFRYLGNIKVLAIILPISLIFTAIPGFVIRYRERIFLKQLNLLGKESWILPIAFTNSPYSKWWRKDNKSKINGSFTGSKKAPPVSHVNNESLKNLEPVLPDLYLRYSADNEKGEPVEIEGR
jgi:UDP-N-acetylmuramyl pentapeptide phosphotransferase/UDP-N-acetylglucosamine-1-phosphate transferase